MRLRLGAALALLVLPLAAEARPVTRVLDLTVGQETFLRSWATAAGTGAPAIATAELLPSHEVLVTAKAPGRALVYFFNQGRIDAVQVRVREVGKPPPELHLTDAQLDALKKACPNVKIEGAGEQKSLSLEVPTPECRKAAIEVLATDEFLATNVELMYGEDALRAQLKDLTAALEKAGLAKTFSVAYAGATLRVKGKAPREQLVPLAAALYDQTVGKVLLDDEIEVLEPPPQVNVIVVPVGPPPEKKPDEVLPEITRGPEAVKDAAKPQPKKKTKTEEKR